MKYQLMQEFFTKWKDEPDKDKAGFLEEQFFIDHPEARTDDVYLEYFLLLGAVQVETILGMLQIAINCETVRNGIAASLFPTMTPDAKHKQVMCAVEFLSAISVDDLLNKQIELFAETLQILPEALYALVNKFRRDQNKGTEIINKALSSGPEMLAEGFVTVEGNARLNQLHVDYIGKTSKTNILNFGQAISRGWELLGIFKTHEEASEFCDYIRSYVRASDDSATKEALQNKI